MRWFAALLLFVPLQDAPAPEKLFQESAAALARAKSLHVRLQRADVTLVGAASVDGSCSLAEGNRLRLEGTLRIGGDERHKLLAVSDGKTLRMIGPGGTRSAATPPNLNATFLEMVSNAGFFGTFEWLETGATVMPKMKLSGFKPGAPEKIGTRDTLSLQFEFKAGEGGTVTLWIDAATKLPVRRRIVVPQWTDATEVCLDLAIDGPVDASRFELPKDPDADLPAAIPIDAWALNSVALSPDGKILAAGGMTAPREEGCQEGVIKIYDAGGKEQRALHHSLAEKFEHGSSDSMNWISHLMFTPDGKFLLASDRAGLRAWNTTTWTQVYSLKTGFIEGRPDLSPDGSILAIPPGLDNLEEGGVRLVVAATGVEKGRLAGTPVKGDPSPPRFEGVGFSPDGRLLAGAGTSGTLVVWDVATKAIVYETQEMGKFTACAFSPDGRLLVAAGQGRSLRVLRVSTEGGKTSIEKLGVSPPHRSGVQSLQFFSRGEKLMAFGESLAVWSVADWRKSTLRWSQITLSADGKVAALMDSKAKTVRVGPIEKLLR